MNVRTTANLRRALFSVAVLASGCGGQVASQKGTASAPAGLIAFARQGPSELDRIYVVEPDGSGQRALTTARTNGYEPVWSPNGKQIAYIAGENEWLYVMNADGNDKRLVSEGAGPVGGATRPSWSPDGKRLLFSVTTFGGHALYVVNEDGTGLRRLSTVDAYYPAWSPRGDVIAVTSRGGRIAELGTNRRRLDVLTPAGVCAQWPTWSPDGTQIAYTYSSGSCANPSAIHVMNADGSHDKALTHPGDLYDQSPAWSPNGGTIAFQRGGPFFGAIYTVQTGDGSVRRIAGALGDKDFDPSWQPETR